LTETEAETTAATNTEVEIAILIQIQLEFIIQIATATVPSTSVSLTEEAEETSPSTFTSVINIIVIFRLQISIQINFLSVAQSESPSEISTNVIKLAQERVPTLTSQAQTTVIELVITEANQQEGTLTESAAVHQLKLKLAQQVIILTILEQQLSTLQASVPSLSSELVIQVQKAITNLQSAVGAQSEIVFAFEVLIQIEIVLEVLITEVPNSELISSLQGHGVPSLSANQSYPIIVKIVFLLELQLKANIFTSNQLSSLGTNLATSANTISPLLSSLSSVQVSEFEIVVEVLGQQAEAAQTAYTTLNSQISSIELLFTNQQKIETSLGNTLTAQKVNIQSIQTLATSQVQGSLLVIIDITVIVEVNINVFHNTETVGEAEEGAECEESETTNTETQMKSAFLSRRF